MDTLSNDPHGGLIRPHHSKLSTLYQITDGAIIIVALYVTSLIHDQDWNDRWNLVALFGAIGFYFFAQINDLYRSWRIVPVRKELTQMGIASLGAAVSLLVLLFILNKGLTLQTLKVLLTWHLVAFSVLTLWRITIRSLFHALRRQGRNTRTVAIIGANPLGAQLADVIEKATWMGLRLTGFYDDRLATDRTTLLPQHQRIGNLNDLIENSRRGEIDMLYITLPLRAENRVKELVARLSDTTISAYIVPDFYAFDLLHSRWYNIGSIPVISIYESPFYDVNGWIKRLEDIIFGIPIMLLSFIPMCLIALGIKLTSAGPVFFRQRRYGINGQEILIWKFRTMTVCEDGPQVTQAKRDDNRLTRFGSFLRQYSLDELPQIINVLQGSMSLVGPRPHAVAHNEQYRHIVHRYMLRHKVKPGITGWAQINGWRGETDTTEKMEKRIAYDLEYISNWTLCLDLRILALTVIRVLADKNAY